MRYDKFHSFSVSPYFFFLPFLGAAQFVTTILTQLNTWALELGQRVLRNMDVAPRELFLLFKK